MEDDLWIEWERMIAENWIVIDRPKGTAHPRFPEMIYPIDYGYLEQTIGGDGAEIDMFVGTAGSGLVGLLSTHDAAQEDRETKLLWNLTEEEIETIVSFLNRGAMTASLIRRIILKSATISNSRRRTNYAISVIPETIALFLRRISGT